MIRVGHDHPQGHHAGRLVHGHVGELEGSFLAILAAIFQLEADTGPVLLPLGQLALGHQALEAQQVGGGLAHVHVHGIELRDGGEAVRLPGGHQGTLGHRRLADAAADGGRDAGVSQVDVGGLQCGLGGPDLGQLLFPGRVGVVILLAADGFHLHQLGVALGLEAGAALVGLGLGEVGLGGSHFGLIDGGINLIEQLTGLDVAPLGEQALEDDAVHLGTHLGHPQGGGAAGELGQQLQGGRMEGDHVHGGGRHLPHGLLGPVLVTTASQQAACQQGKADRTCENMFMHQVSEPQFQSKRSDKTTGFIRPLLVKRRR